MKRLFLISLILLSSGFVNGMVAPATDAVATASRRLPQIAGTAAPAATRAVDSIMRRGGRRPASTAVPSQPAAAKPRRTLVDPNKRFSSSSAAESAKPDSQTPLRKAAGAFGRGGPSGLAGRSAGPGFGQRGMATRASSLKMPKTLEEARKIYGVKENATGKDIKKAYRKLAKVYHPDIIGGAGQEMQIINDTLEFLLANVGVYNNKSYDSGSSSSFYGYDSRVEGYKPPRKTNIAIISNGTIRFANEGELPPDLVGILSRVYTERPSNPKNQGPSEKHSSGPKERSYTGGLRYWFGK